MCISFGFNAFIYCLFIGILGNLNVIAFINSLSLLAIIRLVIGLRLACCLILVFVHVAFEVEKENVYISAQLRFNQFDNYFGELDNYWLIT